MNLLKLTLSKIIFILTLFCICSISVNATDLYDGYIIKFNSSPNNAYIIENELDELEPLSLEHNLYLIRDKSDEFINKLSYAENIDYIEPNYIISIPDDEEINELPNSSAFMTSNDAMLSNITGAFTTPNDPLYSSQWNLPLINASKFWQTGISADNIKIGIIDSGDPSRHPDILNNVVHSIDYTDTYKYDDFGHSTFISGIIASDTNNSMGTAGMLPKTSIISFKTFVGNTTSLSLIAKALDDAINTYSCDVINLSLTTSANSPVIKTLVENAAEQNIILVAAVGNDGTKVESVATAIKYPAAYDDVVGVGSLTKSKKRAGHTQRNNTVNVLAPGESIYSTKLSISSTIMYTYGTGTGTSYATPHVSAAAAIAKTYDRDINIFEFLELLEKTSDPIDGEFCGYGAINIKRMIDYLEQSEPTKEPIPTKMPNDIPDFIVTRYLPSLNADLSRLTSTIYIKNNLPNNMNVNCYIASYSETIDDNGNLSEILIDCHAEQNINIESSQELYLSKIGTKLNISGSRAFIRIYLWDDELKPLMEPYEYEIKL